MQIHPQLTATPQKKISDKSVELPKNTIIAVTAETDAADISESKSQVQTQDHRNTNKMEQTKNTNLSQETKKKYFEITNLNPTKIRRGH
jgi:hypothetical protein